MTLVVKTVSDSRDAQRDLSNLENSLNGIQSSIDKATSAFAKFGAGIGASLAIAGTLKGLTSMADEFTNLENKIKSVTDSSGEFNRALQGVKDTAMKTRSDLQATASLYQRIALNQKEIGINTTDTLRVVELTGKSLKLSGASAQEATAAMLQFGQAIGSGKLQGDELKSLAENAPLLLKTIAEGMKVPISQMKQLGADGEITASKILKAILDGGKKIDDKYKELGVTWGGAFTNLGTGFKILKDSATKYFFGTSDFMARWVNDVGMQAANIGKYFAYYMASARASVMEFVIRAIVGFESLWPAIKEVATQAGQAASELFDKWAPVLKELTTLFTGWAISGATAIKNYFFAIVDTIAGTDVYKRVSAAVVGVKNAVVDGFKAVFSTLGISMPEIDVGKFFKNLDPVMAQIQNFVQVIERAFFWLYDKVIGHSWIPDLVGGIQKHLGLLNGKPKTDALNFTSDLSAGFAGVGKLNPFAPIMKGAKGFLGFAKTALLAVAALFSGFTLLEKFKAGNALKDYNKTLGNVQMGFVDISKIEFEPITDASEKKLNSANQSIKEMAKNAPALGERLKKALADNPITHTIKQLMGMKDTAGGTIFGKTIDSTGEVGRGPARRDKDRPFLHDVVNALPDAMKVPLFVGFTGIISAALAASIKQPELRLGVISLFTAAATAVAFRTIGAEQIKAAAFGFGNTVLDIINKGLTGLLGGNAIKDPFGLVLLLAKFALLFKAGRQAIGGALGGVLRTPAAAGRILGGDTVERWGLRRDAQSSQRFLDSANSVAQKMNSDLQAARTNYSDRIADLQKRTSLGVPVDARMAVNMAKTGTSADPALRSLAAAAGQARDSVRSARDALNAFPETVNRTRRGLEANNARMAEMDVAAQARRAALRDGIVNAGAGLGGVVGGVAGFQLGNNISQKMDPNTPEWQKLAVTMGTAFAGQFILSGVGAAIGSAINLAISPVIGLMTGAFSTVGSKLVSGFMALPMWVQFPLALTAVFYIAYQLLQSLPDKWREALGLSTAESRARQQTESDARVEATRVKLENAVESIKAKAAKEDRPVNPVFDAAALNMGYLEREAVRSKLQYEVSEDTRRANLEQLEVIKSTFTTLKDGLTNFFSNLNKSAEPVKRASGGWISGPGTSKSDSIPAMLSNGEFVVNAEDAKKNRGLLESINSGGVSHFAEGGMAGRGVLNPGFGQTVYTVDPKSTITIQVPETVSLDKVSDAAARAMDMSESVAKNLGKYLDQSFNGLKEALKGNDSALKVLDMIKGGFEGMLNPPKLPEPTKTTTPVAPPAETDFKDAISKMSVEKAAGAIADVLQKSGGFKDVKGADIAALQSQPEALDKILTLTSKLKYFEKIGNSKSIAAPMARAEADNLRAAIQEVGTKAMLDSGEAPTKFKSEQVDEEDRKNKAQKALTLEDQFKTIGDMFPKFNQSLEEFRKLPDAARNEIFRSAYDLSKDLKAVNEQTLGIVNTRDPRTGKLKATGKLHDVKSQEAFDSYNKKQESEQARLMPMVESNRSFAANIRARFANAGVSLQENIAGVMTDGEANLFKPMLSSIEAWKKEQSTEVDLPEGRRAELAKLTTETSEQVNTLQAEIAARVARPFERFNILGASSGIQLDTSTFYKIPAEMRDFVLKFVAEMDKNQKDIKSLVDKPDEAAVKQAAWDDRKKLLDKYVESLKRPTDADRIELAGTAFAQTMQDSFSNGLSGLLKGKRDGDKSVIRTFLEGFINNFTSSVIDIFVKSLTNKLFDEDGPLGTVLKAAGGSVQGTGAAAGGAILARARASAVGTPLDAAKAAAEMGPPADATEFVGPPSPIPDVKGLIPKTEDLVPKDFMSGIKASMGGLMKNLFSGANGIFDMIKGGLGQAASWVSGLFLADGGFVSGPGTSTSDSIPAMLSNGEFVVNASATRQFAPLLHSINTGTFGKFADGGMVGASMIAVPTAADIRPTGAQSSSQQVVNLNITGDISRQTKSEIYRMLPSIAQGVNAQNREKGYKG